MFLTKFKFAALALLALAVVASGAGFLARRPAAPGVRANPLEIRLARPVERREGRSEQPEKTKGKGPARAEEKPPQAKEDVAKEEASSGDRAFELRKVLNKTIDYAGLEDPKGRLIDELDRLARIYQVTFDVNESAFKAETVNAVLKHEIANPNAIPAMKVSFRTVLRKILMRLPPSTRPIFVVRNDVIEITTERAFRAEIGMPAPRTLDTGLPPESLLPLADVYSADTPLTRVLADVAADNAFSIVIDPRVQEAAGARVSVRLRNAPLDVAVPVLANMAGLGAVRMGNLFYVTSQENAAKLQPGKPEKKQNKAPASTDKNTPRPNKDAVKEEAPRRGREAELRDLLRKTFDYPGLDDPKATLIDDLDRIARLRGVTFNVNEEAFKADKVEDVLKVVIANPEAIPPMKAPLEKVLRKILSRLSGTSPAMFFLRKDVIEITTERAFRGEMGLHVPGPDQPLLPIVRQEFHKTPLTQILPELVDGIPFNIVIDPRVQDRGKVEVSARLANVPLDIAVRVLADMGGMGVVRKGNVFYVTSPENAAKLQPATKKDDGKKTKRRR